MCPTATRYYYTTGRAGERITVCLLIGDGKILARGVAACSLKDQFVKKIGRKKALTRVHQAMGREKQERIRGYMGPLPEAPEWCPFDFLWYIYPTLASPLEEKILKCAVEQLAKEQLAKDEETA